MRPLKTLPFLLTVSILISSITINAKEYMKYGKISEKEMSMTICPVDSNASAVVLGALGKTEFHIDADDISTTFTKHVRIKVFDKESFDKGNFKIYLYKDKQAVEKVGSIKGAVYNMKNGKIEKSKLTNNNIFKKELDHNHDVINVALPDVQEGSIIEFRYTLESPFIFNLQPWYFQENIPTLYSEYNVGIIEWYNYKNWMEGYININRTEETLNQKFSFRTERKTAPGLGGGTTPSKNIEFDALVKHIKYTAQNVPAFKNEPYITTPSDYLSSIHFELQSHRYPWGDLKNYTTSWDKINNTLLENFNFGIALGVDGHLKDIAESIKTSGATLQEKACKAYEHITRYMLWNSSFRLYATNTLRKAYNNHGGSSADINLNLVALCRKIGLNANPVIISTRKHGMVRPGLVSLTQFNHVIVAVNIEGKYLLMDATDKNCPYNLLPAYSLNGKGRLVQEGIGSWVDLYSKTPSSEAFLLNLTMDQDFNLHGDFSYLAKNYAAIKARNHFNNEDSEEAFIEDFEEDLGDTKLTDVQIENTDNLTAPFIIKSKIKIKNRVQQAGELAFLNPKLIKRTLENIFKREERVYPVDYNYPINERYILTLSLPKGYVIEELPEKLISTLSENGAKYLFSVSKLGDHMIQFQNLHQINQTLFSSIEYPDLKKFNEMIVSKEAEQIVLKKVN